MSKEGKSMKVKEHTIADDLDSIEVERLSDEQIATLEKLRQEIEYLGIDEIHPSENRARKNVLAVPRVAASIRQVGFRSPIFVNAEDNEIINGHTRWAAAKKLGLTKVPVVRVSDLSPSLIRLLRLADNRVAEFAQWDFSEYNKEIESLTLDLPDIDFDGLGLGLTIVPKWRDVDPINEENYEEPIKQCIRCPKCGYVGGKRFFLVAEDCGK